MEEKDIPDLNIFMVCEKPHKESFKQIPKNYHLRTLRENELEKWFEFPFDTIEGDKTEYLTYMQKYFNAVYSQKKTEFFERCLVLCDKQDNPVSTCFCWKAYGKHWTIHWLKTLKHEEGKGLGRAILTEALKRVPENEYPIYLHTQPGSFRAIKIYSDFGFKILTDDFIGNRENQIKDSMKYLEHFMGSHFNDLKFTQSNGKLSKTAKSYSINEF